MDKKQIRDLYKKKRSSLSEEERLEMSEKALAKLVNCDDYKNANHIFAFINMGTEINTKIAIKKFLEDEKKVYVPITKKGENEMKFTRLRDLSHLVQGNFGVPQPGEEYIKYVDHNLADLVLVPGLSFDTKGYRTGYGGGFYDRFFASITTDCIKVGYCFSTQLSEEDLPTNQYDIAVDYVITD